eukprot:TRINITY_DN4688_c0_g1_i1.p2 TRINITY_DN4688_c0_g1~~TRINITY_DN4688_c0_g1_i1.p2  ORF type:complete len:164 (-),score=28.81 TRINITY_DN4688_c0_g1_i1:395-886(-)
MPLGLEFLGRAVMRRMSRGLYAGKQVGFGNRVSEDGGNKTRRRWKPNVQKKRFFSPILGSYLKCRVSMHAMRCIDKAGTIDDYLLYTPDKKLNSEFGSALKSYLQFKIHQYKEEAELLHQQQQSEGSQGEKRQPADEQEVGSESMATPPGYDPRTGFYFFRKR